MSNTHEKTSSDCDRENRRFVFPLSAPALLIQPADLSSVARVLKRCPRDM